jgi:aldehyde dehydrogenase (NAD+)
MLAACEDDLIAALRADLGKAPMEAYGTEIGLVKAEAKFALRNLSKWMRPERVSTPLVSQPGSARVVAEPLGVVLIIAPWNYPVQLALSPLVGALAAGNCAVLKPSEVAPHTSALLAEMVPRFLDARAVRVIEGGADETTALLREKWDHIFYTGNGRVGRIVMRAAAEHLTPVTLELGGKSPTFVDKSIDIELAARRIAWGKLVNAGQTCVAPDYVLALDGTAEAFVAAFGRAVTAFFGADPRVSSDYPRIVNERHARRLAALLEDQTIALGGKVAVEERYVSPTVVLNPSVTSPLMTEEIFGPILPVLSMPSLDAAIHFVNERPKPLALYVFSTDRAAQERVFSHTSSGGGCINDTLSHVGFCTMPFGGVGESGMGGYHGKASFDTFSHRRSIYERVTAIDLPVRYAPYRDKLKLVKRVL